MFKKTKPVLWIDDGVNAILVVNDDGVIILRGKEIGCDKELAYILSKSDIDQVIPK